MFPKGRVSDVSSVTHAAKRATSSSCVPPRSARPHFCQSRAQKCTCIFRYGAAHNAQADNLVLTLSVSWGFDVCAVGIDRLSYQIVWEYSSGAPCARAHNRIHQNNANELSSTYSASVFSICKSQRFDCRVLGRRAKRSVSCAIQIPTTEFARGLCCGAPNVFALTFRGLSSCRKTGLTFAHTSEKGDCTTPIVCITHRSFSDIDAEIQHPKPTSHRHICRPNSAFSFAATRWSELVSVSFLLFLVSFS